METLLRQTVAISTPTSTRIMTPISATTAFNGPAVTVAPIANIPTANVLRLSRENNSPGPIGNNLRPSTAVQIIPQALNNEVQRPSDEFEMSTLMSAGDSTTLTIVTGGLWRTSSIRTSSGAQQHTVPAVT
jgi:hypothetical protein